MTLTLIYDLDLQSPASYGHDYSHAKVRGQQSVGSEDRVETNGRTDRWTDGGDCITSIAYAVGEKVLGVARLGRAANWPVGARRGVYAKCAVQNGAAECRGWTAQGR